MKQTKQAEPEIVMTVRVPVKVEYRTHLTQEIFKTEEAEMPLSLTADMLAQLEAASKISGRTIEWIVFDMVGHTLHGRTERDLTWKRELDALQKRHGHFELFVKANGKQVWEKPKAKRKHAS